MRTFLIAAVLLASPAAADDLAMDAWGLAQPGDAERSGWAGARGEDPALAVAAKAGTEVLFYLGEKSLVAGRGHGQAVALVLDGVGNLVADGTEVTITLDRAAHKTATSNGIAALQFAPGTTTGQFHAGAGIAGVQSGRAEYDVTPDLASIAPVVLADDGTGLVEDFHDILTAPMADRFGNRVADGTGVSFLLTGKAGAVTILSGMATGGVARGRLLARDMGMLADLSGAVRATLGDRSSDPVAFGITPLAPLGPLAYRAEMLADTGAIRLTVGPFLTDAGHALNDGAPVSATAQLADGKLMTRTAWVLDGSVTLNWLADASDLPMVVTIATVLGTRNFKIGKIDEQVAK